MRRIGLRRIAREGGAGEQRRQADSAGGKGVLHRGVSLRKMRPALGLTPSPAIGLQAGFTGSRLVKIAPASSSSRQVPPVKSDLERLLREALRSLVPACFVRSGGSRPGGGRARARHAARRLPEQHRHAHRQGGAQESARTGAGAGGRAAEKRAGLERGSGRRRLHQFPPGEGRLVHAAQERGGPGRGLRTQQRGRRPQGDDRVRLGQSHGPHARGPRPRRGVWRDARQPARGHRALALSRVLRQRCRPADRHPRGQRLSTLSRAVRRKRRVPVEWLSRRIHPARGAGAAREARRCTEAARGGHRARRSARCAGRRQGQAHRWAHRECAPRCWARRNSIPSCCSRAIAMLADIRNDLEEFGVRFDNWYSERELDQQRRHREGARRVARERPRLREGRRHLVQVHGLRR